MKQLRATNTTNFVFGYRYTVIPKINFLGTPSLIQATKNVGIITAISDQPAAGHNGFMGVEFLFHNNIELLSYLHQ